MQPIFRRDLLRTSFAGAFAPLPLLAVGGVRTRRPNLLYVFPDEWRQQAFGFMRRDPVLTPKSVRDYFAMITGIGRQFARLLRALKESGQYENTIVVFSSDHGEMMGRHNRMGKGVVYEESFLIPFILRYPGALKPHREALHFNTPGIMPTLLGLMGLGGEIPASVEGCDCSRLLLTGVGSRPKSTFFIGGMRGADVGSRAVRTDRYTFVVNRTGAPGVTLCDRQEDPWHLTDCAAAKPDVCRELTEEMDRWLKKTKDPWGEIAWPINFRNVVSVVPQGDGFSVALSPSAPGGGRCRWGRRAAWRKTCRAISCCARLRWGTTPSSTSICASRRC